MMKLEINKEEFEKWQREKWIEYAAVRIRYERLVWSVNLNGEHIITFGDNELYRGFAFDTAKAAWDGA